jgi:hypothetical protein
LLAATSEADDPELESIIDQARLAGDHEVQVVILDALARRARNGASSGRHSSCSPPPTAPPSPP